MGALRVELFFDDEASNWHYRVPALHINGGGTPGLRQSSMIMRWGRRSARRLALVTGIW